MRDLNKMIPNLLSCRKSKIILSPHYDDLALSIGGTLKLLAKKNIRMEEIILFSDENYIVLDKEGNRLKTSHRIETISNIRYNEEIHALKRIGKIDIIKGGLEGALIRGHKPNTSLHHFPHGFNPDLDAKTKEKIRKIVSRALLRRNSQIFVPLAVREHIDHLLVRESVMGEIKRLGSRVRSDIFFYEDLPYIANATKKDMDKVNTFISKHNLQPLIFPIDLNSKLDLLDFYNSQIKNSYYSSVSKHAKDLSRTYKRKKPCERIYFLKKDI